MATTTFAFTGAAQTFVVPAGVTSITVDAYGAEGAKLTDSPGGLGGRTQGNIAVTPGETLQIFVGGAGDGAPAGFNGGGRNGLGTLYGGGATDLRQGGAALANRVIVAPGGGARSNAGGTNTGGAGGGLTGVAGGGAFPGAGGTQTAGGAGFASGALGVGGSSANAENPGGGGGGGFYGGGAGNSGGGGTAGSGGGGGSALVPAGGTTTAGVRTGSGTASLTYNVAPNAPTLVAPLSGTIDRTATQRFSWTFSDPDGGDSQSKYDLRTRPEGGAYTTVTGITTSQFHDFVAGTFPAGPYEWSVRTYDAAGVVGPYASSGFFTAATPPTAPTITAPVNGATVGTASVELAWSYPTQQAYQAQLLDASDVVLSDTGVVESITARATVFALPTNNVTRKLRVRVRDAGLFSPYSVVTVTVSYTPPAVPTLILTASNSTASIAVAITNPAPGAGQPTVVSHDVYRREGGVGDGIRIATGVVAGSTFTDRTVASGVDYSYRVVSVATNGTSSTSAWVA